MTNREWMTTLTNEQYYQTMYWLFFDYGKRFIDTKLGILKWLDAVYSEDRFKESQSMPFVNYYYPQFW